MRIEEARFWAETIEALLKGKQVIFIDSAENRGWQPRSEVAVVTGAFVVEYSYKKGTGMFSVQSTYGVHDGFERVEFSPDNGEIIMYSEHGGNGRPHWRVIRSLESRDHTKWIAAQNNRKAMLRDLNKEE